MMFVTAYGALIEFGKLEAGETVLIGAASSSVGLAAIQDCEYGWSDTDSLDAQQQEKTGIA